MLVTIVRLDGHAINMEVPCVDGAPPEELSFAERDGPDRGIDTTFKKVTYRRNMTYRHRNDNRALYIYF